MLPLVIPVRDAALVSSVLRLGDLHGDAERFLDRKWSLFQTFGQGLPVYQFHHQGGDGLTLM